MIRRKTNPDGFSRISTRRSTKTETKQSGVTSRQSMNQRNAIGSRAPRRNRVPSVRSAYATYTAMFCFWLTTWPTWPIPAARDLIKTAFAEDMVETFFIDEKFVEDLYERGGEPARTFPDWLERYGKKYKKCHLGKDSRR